MITLLAGVALLAGACDPAATSGGEADAGKTDAKAGAAKAQDPAADAKAGEAATAGEATAGEATAGAEAPPSEAPAPATLDGCLGECERGELSEDDLATCRLQCKASHGEAETKHPTIGAYFACFDGCVGKSADDRATCQKNCAASVTAGTGDPAAAACPRACVEILGSCMLPCEDKSSDDKATCHKQCEVPATKCVEACEA